MSPGSEITLFWDKSFRKDRSLRLGSASFFLISLYFMRTSNIPVPSYVYGTLDLPINVRNKRDCQRVPFSSNDGAQQLQTHRCVNAQTLRMLRL